MWFRKLKAHDDKLKTRLKHSQRWRQASEACQNHHTLPLEKGKQTPADSEILGKDARLTPAVTTSCPSRKQLVSSHHWYPQFNNEACIQYPGVQIKISYIMSLEEEI